MSVASMIRRAGSRATVYRGTPATDIDGNRVLGAPWTVLAAQLGILLQPIGDTLVQRKYGTDQVIKDEAYIVTAVAIDPVTDRLVITSGHRTGERFRVITPNDWAQRSPNDHLELALESTTEVFP